MSHGVRRGSVSGVNQGVSKAGEWVRQAVSKVERE